MTPQTTKPADAEDDRGTETRTLSLRRFAPPLAALSGVLLLVGAAREATDHRRRAGGLALAGGALLAAWVRRQGRAAPNDPETPDATLDEGTGEVADEVSDEAAAHREQSKVLGQDETNPRGTSGEPDVATETEPDEGDIQFTTDRDGGSDPKPRLDDESDPRVPDDETAGDDDHVEVDLSEAAMADEASEATGPTAEQSYPAMEGTDPEPTADEAPEREGDADAANESDTAADDGTADTGNETTEG